MVLRFREPLQLHELDVAIVTRDLDAQLEPGDYTLTVTMRRHTGERASSSTSVSVLPSS